MKGSHGKCRPGRVDGEKVIGGIGVVIVIALLVLLIYTLARGLYREAADLKRMPMVPFYMCYGGHEFYMYRDKRTDELGVAMIHDVTENGYEPRKCDGTPGGMLEMNRIGEKE
ncbi:MAG: hypothetical protein LBR80_04660 [Deltaproteobacteria bacterium]|nr:hypothetical protein [Deltaproteobacteria bacterium]